ncbi:hypothetical protein JCM10908_004105 [Rhodotorula pacifica]|uniref:uncharacterized protein n=1 Tax=Rhodotorula pacifica TaxID=1495444 RepID=UPI00316CE9F4
MQLDAVHEELLVLTSSLLDGELAWDDDDARLAWESDLSGETPVASDLPRPSLSLLLCDRAELAVQYDADTDMPDLTLHCAGLEREDQVRLTHKFEAVRERTRSEGAPLPVFTVFTALQEYLATHPPAEAAAAAGPATKPVQGSGPLQLKVVLMWSHHLLATSKRKDIVAWSHELDLWVLSRPGYPGVIVAEGLAHNVDSFVQIVKSWQWKALQVRCEIDGDKVDPPSGMSAREAPLWAVRTRSHLGKVLDPEGKTKVGAREVEGLNELGEIMRSAGLEDVFLTAMKLQK